MRKKKITILPYALRRKIWDLIHKGKTNHQIVEEVFKKSESYIISDDKFIQCISANRSLYDRGIKPDPKSIISLLGRNRQIRFIQGLEWTIRLNISQPIGIKFKSSIRLIEGSCLSSWKYKAQKFAWLGFRIFCWLKFPSDVTSGKLSAIKRFWLPHVKAR